MSERGSSLGLREAYGELWAMVRRRPVRDRGWREFWIVFLPGFVPASIVLTLVDPPLLSVSMAIVVLGGATWIVVLAKVLGRLGVVGRSRVEPDGHDDGAAGPANQGEPNSPPAPRR